MKNQIMLVDDNPGDVELLSMVFAERGDETVLVHAGDGSQAAAMPPGCGAPARRCDLDHTKDWQYHGLSNHNNLAHLCPKHHGQKHHTRWKVEHLGDGDLHWTSPTGHTYITEPATRMEPPPPF